MDFSTQLAAIRRERGLTQMALAERAGINVSMIRRYEAGRDEPTLGVLRRLVVALSTTSDTLVFGEDTRLPDDERIRLAFEATVHLDHDEREAVVAMLEGFLARHTARHGGEGPRARRTKAT